ncbi:hypothetical protein PENTCL1PPCAC_13873, partial [Pristionchus entomophagus]
RTMADPGAATAGDPAVDDLVELDCLQITAEHIRANGTLHSSPFAGVAELIDNAVDSGAKYVKIDNRGCKKGDDATKRHILVMDDGSGMDRKEALKTILVGHSMKRADETTIGQFGNGLKSGSMRLGETMLLATKKNEEYTVLMICLRYMATVVNQKCYVPCISYRKNRATKKLEPIRMGDENTAKHATALAKILHYSPFKTEGDLHNFLKTSIGMGPTGTTVCISNLRKLEDDTWEMKNRNDELAVVSRDGDERNDEFLSTYLQQLYFNPKVVIKINSKQVRLQDPVRSLADPRWTLLSNTGLNLFAKRKDEYIDKEVKRLEAERVKAKANQTHLFNLTMDNTEMSSSEKKKLAADHRRVQREAEEYQKTIENLNEQKTNRGADIRVYFGIDVEKRGEPRMVFYSNGRRICDKRFLLKGDTFKQLMGVVCLIDIPSTFLPTATNREHFEITSELEVVVKKILPLAKLYFAHADKKYKTAEFWKSLGYDHPYAEDSANIEKEGVQKMMFEMMGNRRQCSRCLHFRVVEDMRLWLNSMENPNFQCPDGCMKTEKEFRDETIKELDRRSKQTAYGEEDEKLLLMV